MPTEALLSSLRAIAEPTRLWILRLLLGWRGPRSGPLSPDEPGRCVSDLVLAGGLPNALVLHHLRILREAGLLESEKRGRWTVYRVRGERLALLGRELEALSAVGNPGTSRAA